MAAPSLPPPRMAVLSHRQSTDFLEVTELSSGGQGPKPQFPASQGSWCLQPAVVYRGCSALRTEAAEGVGAGQSSKSLCAKWTDTHSASRTSTSTSVHLLCTYCVSRAVQQIGFLSWGWNTSGLFIGRA